MIPLLEGISLHDHICHEVSLTTRLPHFLRCTWWILLDHLSISTLGLHPPFCREDEYDYILKLRVQIHVCYMPLTTSNSPSASTSPQKDGGQLYDLLVMCYGQSASSVYVSLEVWLAPLVLKQNTLIAICFSTGTSCSKMIWKHFASCTQPFVCCVHSLQLQSSVTTQVNFGDGIFLSGEDVKPGLFARELWCQFGRDPDRVASLALPTGCISMV